MGSGYKNFTAGSVLTASDVNNYLMEQGVMYFATTAARDSAITSPEDGMVAYVGSNDSSEGLYTYNGSAWRKGPGWNAPWGVLGISTSTSNFTTSSTHTTFQDVGLSVSIPYVNRRYLRVTYNGNILCPGGNNAVEMNILRGATTVRKMQLSDTAVGNTNTWKVGFCMDSVFATSSTTTETFKCQLRATINNTSVADFGDGDTVRSLIVEDIGPSGAPA
jgi:hypothetical protein